MTKKMEQPSRELKDSVRSENLTFASTEYTHRFPNHGFPNHVSLALSIPHFEYTAYRIRTSGKSGRIEIDLTDPANPATMGGVKIALRRLDVGRCWIFESSTAR